MSESSKYPQRRGPWLVTGTQQVHRTPWLSIRDDQIVWPDKREAVWTVIEFKPAIGVVALTEDGQVHLVGQHRYAVNRYEWELPEGLVDEGEDFLEAAKRELQEETGYAADKLRHALPTARVIQRDQNLCERTIPTFLERAFRDDPFDWATGIH